MDKKVTAEVRTISQVDIIKAKITQDLDSLEKLLLDNYSNKWSDYSTDTRNEDSYCPPSPIVDEIIEEMQTDFYAGTQEKIVCSSYWGHIHEKNMSTNTHNHGDMYVSAVLYVDIPEGCGNIVFAPRFNQYNNAAYYSSFKAERGVYYMFPGYLDHYVTRNNSEEKRVSISFNFHKDENSRTT
mgnify:CR=1 FL=1